MNTSNGDRSRVWLITGSASGMGRALAEAALARDERVILTSRNLDRIADVTQRYPQSALALELDVTVQSQVHTAIATGIKKFGRLDVVVNNAGYGLFGAFEDFSEQELRTQCETNVFGAFTVTREVLPYFRRQRSGQIVQISSLEGIAPGLPGESAYAATKFAVEGFCEALAKEVRHLGIHVTIVEPGPVRTNFVSAAAIRAPSEDYVQSVGATLELFDSLAGNQPNDPALVAKAIIEAVEASEPPLRLALGAEALAAISKKLEAQLRELNTWAYLGKSTGFSQGM